MVKRKEKFGNSSSFIKTTYGIFHFICGLFALYVAIKCNNGISFLPILFACCCPYLYLVYIAATKGLHFCIKDFGPNKD